MSNNPTLKPATARQLRYLRVLAKKTGTTFTPPTCSRQASREIDRMRRLPVDRDPRERQPAAVTYATAPDAREITGYGIRARWRHTRPPKQDGPEATGEAGASPHRVRARVIATYQEDENRRQILSVPAGEHRLLIDREPDGHGHTRLLARLDPDEPPENERLIADMYLADPNRGRCRPLTRADLDPVVGHGDSSDRMAAGRIIRDDGSWRAPLLAGVGATFQIERVHSSGISALRWAERNGAPTLGEPVALRQVVAQLEDYQPAVAMTRAAIDAHRSDPECSVVALRNELARLQESPIVLNRRLRERVQHAIEHEQLTMSEIAVRCGRARPGKRGRPCGETSWLARRIGLLPEAGHARPTPWVHTDVLALIARDGLGVNPIDVELSLERG